MGNRKILHPLISDHARDNGDRIAVEAGAGRISYGELDRWSNALAGSLRSEGIAKDDVAGLFFEPGISYIIGLLAVNKSGGIFMPLEVSYPEKRLQHLLDRVRPKLILTEM